MLLHAIVCWEWSQLARHEQSADEVDKDAAWQCIAVFCDRFLHPSLTCSHSKVSALEFTWHI